MRSRLLTRWLFVFPLALRGLARLVRSLLGAGGLAGRRIRGLWRGLSQFAQNLFIGVLIAVLIHLGHGSWLVRELEDQAVDWMNRLQVDTAWLNPPGRLGYTLLDMDEATFDAWGEPFHVPRERLAELIRYAAAGGARAIVVDVDLTRPGTDPAADRVLCDLIAGYPVDAPDLILLRTAKAGTADGSRPLRWREIYFDASRLSEAVHFAHSRYVKDRSDLRLRRWRLVERGCLDGRPLALPSAQLLLDVLLQEGRPGWSAVQGQLAASGGDDCSQRRSGEPVEALDYGPGSVRLDAGGVDQRVIYSYSDAVHIGKAPIGLERIPAGVLVEHLAVASPEPVRERVVVIGASYEDSRDLHETPVGRMPGALVLLNAIKSLNQFGQLHGPATRFVLLIEICSIVLMAWLFSRLDSWWATMLTGSLMALILVPVSFWWFRYGVWVDLAGPILAMQVHQTFASWEEARVRSDQEA